MEHSNHPQILIISDLHLTPDRPDITAALLRFLRDEAPAADALYILGDLFEAWIGDDDDNALNSQVARGLKQVSLGGTRIYFIGGNRDFLVGQKYARQCGMTLLPEHTVHKLFGVPTLLMHGDSLCIDDLDYQYFRNKRLHWWWRTWRLSLPLWLRRNIARRYRQRSKNAKSNKQLEIMDLNPDAIVREMDASQAVRLIHGHTHRPGVQPLDKGRERVVLGDWFSQGSVLVITPQGLDLQSRSLSE